MDRLGLGEKNRLLGTFSLTISKLLHQQMIPLHYLPSEQVGFCTVMDQERDGTYRAIDIQHQRNIDADMTSYNINIIPITE